MIKLTDAKCPNCEAEIQVNKELEKSICQYCGNTISIKEAIQKMQINNKIAVDGIATRNEELEKAIKHIKLEEYGKADKILEELYSKDEFDIEATAYLIKNKIKYLKSLNFKIYSCSGACFKNLWNIAKTIIDKMERLEKIDNEKESDKILGEDKNYIVELKKGYADKDTNIYLDDKLNEAQKILGNVLKKYTTNVATSELLDTENRIENVIVNCFGEYAKKIVSIADVNPINKHTDYCHFYNLVELYQDGGAYVEYDYVLNYQYHHKKKILIVPSMDEICESTDELLEKCKKFENMLNEEMTPGIMKFFNKLKKK